MTDKIKEMADIWLRGDRETVASALRGMDDRNRHEVQLLVEIYHREGSVESGKFLDFIGSEEYIYRGGKS